MCNAVLHVVAKLAVILCRESDPPSSGESRPAGLVPAIMASLFSTHQLLRVLTDFKWCYDGSGTGVGVNNFIRCKLYSNQCRPTDERSSPLKTDERF